MKQIINTSLIEEAVCSLCLKANTHYPRELYEKINSLYKKNSLPKYAMILKNAQIAYNGKRPLCQDTGQVIVFVKAGKDVYFEGKDLNTSINEGVKRAYTDYYFRKSTVHNSIFDRTNTKDNTPAIIYHEITEGNEVELNILIKGAGAENYSCIKMFNPAEGKNDIFKFIKETVQNAGERACPPLVLGIGIGGTMEKAALLSKEAFFTKKTDLEKELETELLEYLKDDDILKVNILTSSTHIAGLPAAITLNCHCTRHAHCLIQSSKILYDNDEYEYEKIEHLSSAKEIFTDEYEKIKNLNKGEEILLSGTIYTARDAAHQRLFEMAEKGAKLPIDLKNKIIFYAGPCPSAPNEIIGPVGPTTSSRMDKFSEFMYLNGILASIGKGERSKATEEIIKSRGKYFSTQGGVACLLAQRVKSAELIAFEDLGAEAVFKLEVEKFPLKTEL